MKPKHQPLPRINLAEQLRRAILESGQTYYALGQRAGVDRATIGRFVDGSGDLKLQTASAIAACLGLKLVESGRAVGGRRKPTELVAPIPPEVSDKPTPMGDIDWESLLRAEVPAHVLL